MSFLETYLWYLEESPLAVKIVTSFIQMALADIFAQQIEHSFKQVKTYSVNIERWLTMCIWACCIQTPIQHWYYLTFLSESNGILMNVGIDQIIWTPIINSTVLYYSGCMNGKDALRSLKYVRSNIIQVYKTSCCVWPIVLFLQLYFFSMHVGFIFNLIVGFFWAIILSYIQNKFLHKSKNIKLMD